MAPFAHADDHGHVDTPIAQVMSATLVRTTAETSVADAAASMRASGVGCAIISDGLAGCPTGVFTERDLLVRVVGAGRDPRHTRVGEVMTRDVMVLEAETPFAVAADLVNQHGFRHVPVVAAGRLVGIVSMRDLFRLRIRWVESQLDAEVRALRDSQALLAMDEAARVRALLAVNRRLQALALTDELTGLYNHRYFVRRLADEVTRSHRLRAPLSLLFADIDHFKRVNDTYGHPHGDMVLQRVAHALRETVEGTGVPVRLRKSDVVTRYGGEEFAVLLLDAQAPGAASVAERIRSAVAEMPIPLPDGATMRVTLSLGVASLPDSAADADRLILAADQALYRAKATGRNRVEVAEPETPRPAGP